METDKKNEDVLKNIESKIKLYPDFPKKGILFRDMNPIYGSPETLRSLIDVLCDRLRDMKFDRILGIESRGFFLCYGLARELMLPFSPIRKKGKLPGELYSIDYELEYGKDTLEIQKDELPKGSKCLIVDDLIATGGTMSASKQLVEMSGSQVVACAVVIELKALQGKEKLPDTKFITIFSY